MKSAILGVFVCGLALSSCAYVEGLHDNSPSVAVDQQQSTASVVESLKERQAQKQRASGTAAKITAPLTH